MINPSNNNGEQLINKSHSYYSNKQYNEAIKSLNEAYTYTPLPNDQFLILHFIGMCYINLECWDDAINYFHDALDINQTLGEKIVKETYYGLGISKYYIKDYENSIEFLTKYIDINPEFRQAYRFRGECFFKKNNFQGSILDLEVYFGDLTEYNVLEDDFKPIIALANSYIQTDQIIKGASLLIKAIEINPDDEFVKISLRLIIDNYFNTDTDSEFPILIKKGELFSEISNILSETNSLGLSKDIKNIFVTQINKVRQKRPTLVMMDVLNIGSNVSIEMFKIWEENIGYINNIHKSYLSYEVAKIIFMFKFSKMDLDKIHISIFQSAFLQTEN